MKLTILVLLSTCMEVSISLSCLFVHEPPYQIVVVCCNPIFAAVLSTQTTVLFSMLKWSSLRLAPTSHSSVIHNQHN